MWQYRLWSFHFRNTKSNRLLPKIEVFKDSIICPPDWDGVNWSAKIWGGGAWTPGTPGSYSLVQHSLQAGMAVWLLRGCFNCHNEAQINNQMPSSIVSAVCGVFSFYPYPIFCQVNLTYLNDNNSVKCLLLVFSAGNEKKRWDGNMPTPQYILEK